MSDALEIAIEEVVCGSCITYRVKVVEQQFRNGMFGNGARVEYSSQFTASNGFRLRSLDVPEVRQKHVSNEDSVRSYPHNTLFVRGNSSGADTRSLEVTSMSYILELGIAIKEYNAQFNRGGDDDGG